MITSRWNHFFFTPIPPHSLAILRILFGAFLLLEWAVYFPRVPMLFSDHGLLVPWITQGIPSFVVHPDLTTAYAIYLLHGICLILFTIGFGMRFSGFIAALLMFYYYNLSFHAFPSSYHRIFLFFLIILSMSGADCAFSLRMKIKRGAWSAYDLVPAWPQRVLQIQLTLTYLGVGLQKLVLPGWETGEVLSYAFIGRWATPLAFWVARLDLPLWFYDKLVFFVKFLHIALPFAFWMPKIRPYAAAFAALFHIGVALLLGMWWFLAMIPAYIVFWDPTDIQKGFERCFRD